MDWIKQRVWQLGVAVLLVLIGSVFIYLLAINQEGSSTIVWVGLVIIFIGLLIPLVSKLYDAIQETEGEEGES